MNSILNFRNLQFTSNKEDISFNILYTGSFKKIIKANKLNSYGCFILGEDEIKENKILWKIWSLESKEAF